VLPALQKEYEEVMQELEKENAEVVEIEACDQDYLNELKASIAEQK
jgi:kinetochore protein Spc7/SPC105